MAVPTYDKFMKPVLELLSDGQEHNTAHIYDVVANKTSLTEQDLRVVTSSGVPTYRDRIHWAITYLFKAGLLSRCKRAHYQITQEGSDFLKRHPGEEITEQVLLKECPPFEEYFNPKGTKGPIDPEPVPPTILDPDAAIEEAHRRINEQLIDDLMQEISAIDDYKFEGFVLELLKAMGYGMDGSVSGTTVSHDGGIDGIIFEDKLGFRRIYVQIKHYKLGNRVQRPELQAFKGAVPGLDSNALFVTSSDFTDGAREYAKSRNLTLLDGRALCQLMIDHNFGVSTRKVYAIKTVDRDLFDRYKDDPETGS